MDVLKSFWKDEGGLEVVEYAIILGIIVVVSLGFIIAIGAWVRNAYADTANRTGAQ